MSDATYDANGNPVTATAYPGGSAAPRLTQAFYDWRNRPVLVKGGPRRPRPTASTGR